MLRGKDPLTGKYVYVSRTVRGGKRLAERTLGELLSENSDRDRGSTAAGTASDRITIVELIEQHLDRHGYSPTTLADYRSVVATYLVPTIGNTPICDVRPVLLDRLYTYLADERKLAPATIRKVHALLRGAFTTAVRWGWLANNPARDASPPIVHKGKIHLPTPDEVNRAVAYAEAQAPDFGVFLRLAAATGARRGELCGLQWRNIDLDGGMVHIDSSAYVVGGDTAKLKDTKNHARRDVSLNATTVDALARHYRRKLDDAATCGVELGGDGFVFSDAPDGLQPWRPDRASHNWDRVRAKTGLTGVRLHDLRHFQATMLLQAGVPVRNVSKRIGHRDAATTLNVYGHALEEVDRRSADVMGRLLDADPVPRPAD